MTRGTLAFFLASTWLSACGGLAVVDEDDGGGGGGLGGAPTTSSSTTNTTATSTSTTSNGGAGATGGQGGTGGAGASDCVAHPVTGEGTTWLAPSPTDVALRPLRCMTDGVATLEGRYVSGIEEGSFVVASASRVYDYLLADPAVNHVESYFTVTELGLQMRDLGPLDPAALDERTGPSFFMGAYYDGTAMEVPWGGAPADRVQRGIVAHEFGHHMLVSVAPTYFVSTMHEGFADFVACVATGSPNAWSTLPQELWRPCDTDASWPDDAVHHDEACPLHLAAMEAGGWDVTYPDIYQDLATQCAALQPPQPVEGHLTGMIVSGALWSLSQAVGSDVVLRLFLHAMSDAQQGDFGLMHQGMLAADATLYGGAHAADITAELTARGMTQDVDLAALEGFGAFPCAQTAEDRRLGRRPPGPLLVGPRL